MSPQAKFKTIEMNWEYIFLFHLTKFNLKVSRKIAQIKLLRELLFCSDMVLFVFIGLKVAQLTFHSNVIA